MLKSFYYELSKKCIELRLTNVVGTGRGGGYGGADGFKDIPLFCSTLQLWHR